MIGDDDQHGVGIVGELLARQARHHAVERFKVCARLRAEGAMLVLRFVKRVKCRS